MRAGRRLRVASPCVGPSSSLLSTRVCDPASLNPREIVDSSFLSMRAGNGVRDIHAALELSVGSSRCLDAGKSTRVGSTRVVLA
ncbi:hypothetical protein F2Q69_00040118 [Brassica cretica]|uniref:Uncharacterized protein n=1 Tax=Brassica cretica TaxID=69181 RepID=A0A8S9NFW9_BRACR|nr:hypothetical protein F2Q69_00040118 [Brassica cretica]